ncbi:MAG: hypothetical protein IT270_05940 [Saprospiraceae bacterium]|nr:hypothetical protein [Saprospiraceae bacterium]
MELDELKAQLRKKMDQDASGEKSVSELTLMLHKSSANAVERIRRNMLYEILFGVVLSAVCAVLALRLQSDLLQFLGAFMLLLLGLQTPVFIVQGNKLKAVAGEATQNLRDTLKNQIFLVDAFIKLYLRYANWLIPSAALFGGFVGFIYGSNQPNDPALAPLDRLLENAPVLGGLAVAVFAVLIIWGSYKYVRWAVWYSYGRHLEKLKLCLAELEGKGD